MLIVDAMDKFKFDQQKNYWLRGSLFIKEKTVLCKF